MAIFAHPAMISTIYQEANKTIKLITQIKERTKQAPIVVNINKKTIDITPTPWGAFIVPLHTGHLIALAVKPIVLNTAVMHCSHMVVSLINGMAVELKNRFGECATYSIYSPQLTERLGITLEDLVEILL